MDRRKTICRVVIAIGLLLYAVALAIALIGSLGLFGLQPDGLAGVYLIVLGFPWSMALLPLASLGVPSPILLIATVAAPLVTLWFLYRLCRCRKREV